MSVSNVNEFTEIAVNGQKSHQCDASYLDKIWNSIFSKLEKHPNPLINRIHRFETRLKLEKTQDYVSLQKFYNLPRWVQKYLSGYNMMEKIHEFYKTQPSLHFEFCQRLLSDHRVKFRLLGLKELLQVQNVRGIGPHRDEIPKDLIYKTFFNTLDDFPKIIKPILVNPDEHAYFMNLFPGDDSREVMILTRIFCLNKFSKRSIKKNLIKQLLRIHSPHSQLTLMVVESIKNAVTSMSAKYRLKLVEKINAGIFNTSPAAIPLSAAMQRAENNLQ